MSRIQAIFFDFDNTLVDYVQSDILALTKLAEHLQVETELFIDRAVHNIMAFHSLWEQGTVDPQEMHIYRLTNTLHDFRLDWDPLYLQIYLNSYLNTYYIYPGVDDLLNWIHGTVRSGLVTNSYLVKEQKLRVQRSGLGKYFDDVLVCAEIGYYKPNPRAFLYLVEKYGLLPSQCLYIGDSEKHDVLGAKSAGLRSVRIVHGEKCVFQTKADFLCQGIDELSQLLSGLLI